MGKKPLPHTQKLDAAGYIESRGIHTFNSEVDAGRGDFFAPAKVLKRLLDEAMAELKSSVPESIFGQVVDLMNAAGMPHSEEVDNEIAGDLWELRTDIAQHTALLSRATMAVSFLVGFALVRHEFRHPGNPSAMPAACFFADAWHYWHMEVFGEHEKAYVAKVRDEGRASATATAALNQQRRLSIVRKVIGDIIDTETNAECSRRLKTVNVALEQNGLRPYPTMGALAKAVGRARKLRR